MPRLFLALSTFLMLVTSSVLADETKDQRIEVAKQIVKLTRVTEAMESIMPTIMQQQMQSLPGRENLSEEQQKAVDAAVKEFTDEFGASFGSMFDYVAELYAKKFSLEELEGVRDFYQSDIGQSFVSGGLELATEMTQYSQVWAQQHIMPAAQRFGAKLQTILQTQ